MVTKQIIVMRTDLNMRKGKMVAQGAHASLAIFTNRFSPTYEPDGTPVVIANLTEKMKEWLGNSFTKICVGIDSEEALRKLYDEVSKTDIPVVMITDNGKTEFGGVLTPTCIAIGPDDSEKIDPFTKNLRLL